jgi:hypothetical protein
MRCTARILGEAYAEFSISCLPAPAFLRSSDSLVAHQHRVPRANLGDVFTLVAYDRSNTRFEIFERFDWPLHWFSAVALRASRELCGIMPRTASLLRGNP